MLVVKKFIDERKPPQPRLRNDNIAILGNIMKNIMVDFNYSTHCYAAMSQLFDDSTEHVLSQKLELSCVPELDTEALHWPQKYGPTSTDRYSPHKILLLI